jgi:hypothetical protein
MAIPLEEELADLDFHLRAVSGGGRASSACLGVVNPRQRGGMTVSLQSGGAERSRALVKLCASIKALAPGFVFTSIVVNWDSRFALHCDAQNVGLSAIVSLGAYTGGELFVDWLEAGPGAAREGGGYFDLRGKALVFNGQAPHMTAPYTGTRITAVFYTRAGWEKCDAKSLELLKEL